MQVCAEKLSSLNVVSLVPRTGNCSNPGLLTSHVTSYRLSLPDNKQTKFSILYT